MTSLYILLTAGGGLSGLATNVITNWIGPIALMIIAGIAVKHLINQEVRKFFTFLALAGIVALVVYGTDSLFGASGTIKGLFESVSQQIK